MSSRQNLVFVQYCRDGLRMYIKKLNGTQATSITQLLITHTLISYIAYNAGSMKQVGRLKV